MRFFREIADNGPVAKTLEKIKRGSISHAYAVVSEDD